MPTTMLMLAVTCAVFFPILANASSSVHGWAWFAAAFSNMLGTKLRPLFGLRV